MESQAKLKHACCCTVPQSHKDIFKQKLDDICSLIVLEHAGVFEDASPTHSDKKWRGLQGQLPA